MDETFSRTFVCEVDSIQDATVYPDQPISRLLIKIGGQLAAFYINGDGSEWKKGQKVDVRITQLKEEDMNESHLSLIDHSQISAWMQEENGEIHYRVSKELHRLGKVAEVLKNEISDGQRKNAVIKNELDATVGRFDLAIRRRAEAEDEAKGYRLKVDELQKELEELHLTLKRMKTHRKSGDLVQADTTQNPSTASNVVNPIEPLKTPVSLPSKEVDVLLNKWCACNDPSLVLVACEFYAMRDKLVASEMKVEELRKANREILESGKRLYFQSELELGQYKNFLNESNAEVERLRKQLALITDKNPSEAFDKRLNSLEGLMLDVMVKIRNLTKG